MDHRGVYFKYLKTFSKRNPDFFLQFIATPQSPEASIRSNLNWAHFQYFVGSREVFFLCEKTTKESHNKTSDADAHHLLLVENKTIYKRICLFYYPRHRDYAFASVCLSICLLAG